MVPLDFEATANVIYNPYNPGGQPIVGLNDQNFSMFIFSIVVGILIGIASVLLIFIAGRSAKGFFKKSDKNTESE